MKALTKQQRMDHVIRSAQAAYHMDASESVWFARELEHIRSKAFQVQYAQFKARLFVPIDNSVNTGAEEYTYQSFDEVGQAKITTNYSSDAPRVDVSGAEATSKLRSLVASYGYNLQEIRNSVMAGRSLPNMKAMTSRRVIEQKLDNILLLGDAEYGLDGFFALSGTNTLAPAGAWGAATPDDIALDMHGAANKIVTDSNEVETPDTMLVPLTAYTDITTRRMGAGDGSLTVLEHFLKTNPYISQVMPSHKLETAGAGSTRRLIAYQRSSEKLVGLIPQEYEQLPPEARSFETIINCHARCGGVVAYFPQSILYMDGI